MLKLDYQIKRWTMVEPFIIAGSSCDSIDSVHVTLTDANGHSGRAETCGVDYHGESVSSICAELDAVRPAIEAGENLGFLPGDLVEKVLPYLRPLYDALYDMMEAEKVEALTEQGIIEVAPLAFMRGRTLNDAFVVLDEAQNSTPFQMKMFLTRLGFDSKTVITGDITQSDLPKGAPNGLSEAENILKDIEGIQFVHLTGDDVVRHELVQRIIEAYANDS